MLLNELKMRSLGVSAESVLPLEKVINIEGKELKFQITTYQSGFGSGKKTVVSGTISLNDTNHTSTTLENADIESIRRKIFKLCGLKTSKPRTPKGSTEVDKLKQSLAVARRLPHQWCKIDTVVLRAFFKEAREADREKAREALKEKAVSPLLAKIEKLSAEERALLLASLQ